MLLILLEERGGTPRWEDLRAILSNLVFLLWADSNHKPCCSGSTGGFDTWLKSLKPAPEDLEIFVKLKCTKHLKCTNAAHVAARWISGTAFNFSNQISHASFLASSPRISIEYLCCCSCCFQTTDSIKQATISKRKRSNQLFKHISLVSPYLCPPVIAIPL